MPSITKYNLGLKSQYNGDAVIDYDTDTIKLALTTSSYTPAPTTHQWFSSITNELAATGGYTSGGATLASKTLTESAGTVTFDAADVTWAQNGSGFTTARYGILYKSTGVAGTSPLIGYIDFLSNKGNLAGDFVIEWGASGIFTAT